MTRPYLPHTFRDGATLDVEALRENFEQMREDLADSVGKRYGTYTISLPFPDLSNTSNVGELTLNLRLSHAWEIVGRELVAFVDTGTLTLSSSVSGFADLSVAAAGATTQARAADERGALVAADTEVSFTVANSAATWSGDLQVNLLVRYDRHQGDPPTFTVPKLDASVSDDASTLNNAISSYATAVSDDGSAGTQRRVETYLYPLSQTAFSASERYQWLPDFGDKITRFAISLCADTTATANVFLRDEAAASLRALSQAGTGAASVVVAFGSVTDTQPDSGPATAANDYRTDATIGGSGGTVYRLLCVVEYEE